MNARDIELTLRARAAFDSSIDRIDADTRGRLRELRLRAQQRQAPRRNLRLAWGIGAALTAAMALVALMPRMSHAPSPAGSHATITTPSDGPLSEMQASVPDPVEAVDPDLLSDLDFYGWLADHQSPDVSGG